MRKKLFLVFWGLVLCGTFLMAQTLDEAIIETAVKISRDLPANTTVAVINFNSDSEDLNNYVTNELYGAILRNRRITPVKPDQSQFQNIRDTLLYSMGNTINKESAQRFGRLLGVQYLITGSIEHIDSEYKIVFSAVNTDAEVKLQYSFSLNPKNDSQFAFLLGGNHENSSPVVSKQSKQEKKQTETDSVDVMSFKFALGNIFGITSFDDTYYDPYYDDIPHDIPHDIPPRKYSGTYLNFIYPIFSSWFLFSLENELRLGLGIDIAAGPALIKLVSTNGGILIATGLLTNYAIIGYNNIYLHIGYDFAFGALYVVPCYTINKHLMIGIPTSLFGGNKHFSLARYIDRPEQYSKYFAIGLSLQYVF